MKKYYLWIIVGFVGLGLAVINIPVEVSKELRGNFRVSGNIKNCDFGGLTKHSSKFFLGVSFEDPKTPYLRMNPELKNKSYYQDMCNKKEKVRVEYYAKKRLVGPVRFWINHVEKI